MSKTYTAAERKAQLLDIGAKLAAKHGAVNVTRRMVANQAKLSEALVSAHMGNNDVARRAYSKQVKKLGLVEPDKATAAAIGTKLRAHKKDDTRAKRPRSDKEIKAIKKATAAKVARETKPAAPKKAPAKKQPAVKPAAPESAARAPKAPPETAAQV